MCDATGHLIENVNAKIKTIFLKLKSAKNFNERKNKYFLLLIELFFIKNVIVSKTTLSKLIHILYRTPNVT